MIPSLFSPWPVGLGMALVVSVLLATTPVRTAWAQPLAPSAAAAVEAGADAGRDGGESLRALNEAKAALGATPPDREAARRAFDRATATADDPGAMAEAYFRLGFLEEEDGAFERALAAQRACMAKFPGSSWARSARQRIHWMTARSEGGFEPLARLQRVRRDPVLGSDPAAIEALGRDAEAFPPGRVRAEARMFVAETWLTRMNRPQDAIPELRKVADDPSSDSMDAGLAHRRLLEAFLAVGRLDDAASELQSAPALDPELSAQVHRLVRRRLLRRMAVAELATFALLAVLVVTRAQARAGKGTAEKTRLALRAAAPLILAAAVTFAASTWTRLGQGAGRWLPILLAVALLPLVVMTNAWSAAGSRRPVAHVGRLLFCGLSMAAATFLLLDAASSKYLEGLGL